MSSYPTSLAPQLNQVPEDAVAGQITPSHGGLISGHEFDMVISQPPHQPQPSSPTNTTSLPAPLPRGPTPNSHRQRPVSMPPQAFSHAGAPIPAPIPTSESKERSHDENRERRRHRDDTTTTSKSSRSNRILGDYTLSKTLGAGSMGKVKLATHNITGEKVRLSVMSVIEDSSVVAGGQNSSPGIPQLAPQDKRLLHQQRFHLTPGFQRRFQGDSDTS
jgi:hypothetical protein